jgi:nucleotide-binding universal stress UspA family protein
MAPESATLQQTDHLRVGFRRLLVPISGTAEGGRAMETACALAAEAATITAVFVIEVSPLLPLDAWMGEEEAAAREALARAEAIADAFGLKIHTRIVRSRDAGRAIIDLAEGEDVELVVICAPHASRLRRRQMAFDGTVRHVLAKAPCRVMVVAGATT